MSIIFQRVFNNYNINFLFNCSFFPFGAFTSGYIWGKYKNKSMISFLTCLVIDLFFISFTIVFSNKVILYLLFFI